MIAKLFVSFLQDLIQTGRVNSEESLNKIISGPAHYHPFTLYAIPSHMEETRIEAYQA